MKFKALLAAAALTALAGCSAVNTSAVVDTGKETTIISSQNNPLLSSRLEIAAVKTATVGELFKAQVELRNRWVFELDFEYKFQWFDQDGFELATEQRPWTRVIFSGSESKFVQATAPMPQAVSFKILVRD
ncbi:YcfL family protein [Pelagibaculum spongiae]|uniref:DUF1425 domain-containing protein n=1 Tax=Pelagibaculum spongiae TaxID=2080658 RepID=A0A2V1GXB0_9GAMM|nr:YcfL family protein [Pelagibaculum spongiae]PVZ71734.1 DUF1425 domain-containing protein [Pelagibaculum spongiae]